MKQLHIVESIAKDFGGLGSAALHHSDMVAKNGIEVKLFVLNRLRPELSLSQICPNLEILGSEKMGFIAVLLALRREIYSHHYNLVHIHGVWTILLAFAAKFAQINQIKFVISPHGCLEPWALSYKKWKKLIALFIYQKYVFNAANLIFATAKQEEESIKALGLDTEIVIIPIGLDLPELQPKIPHAQRRFLFLSRIHPKKGLFNLVNAWSKVRRSGWRLIIAGPSESGHLEDVLALIKSLGLEEDFEFPGLVIDDKKEFLFRGADVFILPSYSENFGIVIAEALSYGVPVITTTGTPWHDLLESGCGWWVNPTVDDIADAMLSAMNLTHEELFEMGKSGRKLIADKFSWGQIGHSAMNAYVKILNSDCISTAPINA